MQSSQSSQEEVQHNRMKCNSCTHRDRDSLLHAKPYLSSNVSVLQIEKVRFGDDLLVAKEKKRIKMFSVHIFCAVAFSHVNRETQWKHPVTNIRHYLMSGAQFILS